MRTTSCPICHRPSKAYSRHCARHSNRAIRYGDPQGKPVVYRKDIAPHYASFIREGFNRLRNHKAMQAALQLTEQALNYTVAEDDPAAFGHQLRVSRLLAQLRAHGITVEALFCRVAEFAAYFEHHQGAMRLREENFALARGVAHMVRWRGMGAGQGVALIGPLGEHLREYVYPAALAFVRRLLADQEKQGELMRAAVDFGD